MKLQFTLNRQYDVVPPAGGGMSLQDILNPDKPAPAVIPPVPNNGGIEPIKEVIPPLPNPGDKPADEPPAPVEGLNADGTLQEGYVKNADGTITKTPASTEVPPEDELTPEAYYETVEKISGIKLAAPVVYPDGIDPLAPEGVAIRERALVDQGALTLENYIETEYPRAYALMLHLQNGNPEETFYTKGAAYQLPALETLRESVDTQKAVYLHSMVSKGVDPEDAEALATAAIKSNKLLEKATAAFNETKTMQDRQIEELRQQQVEAERHNTEQISKMTKLIATTIETGISYQVPPNQRAPLQKFMEDNLRYDSTTGNFMLVQEVKPENIGIITESMVLQYLKGDLSKIVKKQAGTVASQRLRAAVLKSTEGKIRSTEPDSMGAKNLPLSETLRRG